MLVGSSSSTSHHSYIPSLIPPGVDPAKVDSKMFYTYVPNTIKTRKRTTPSQLEILEGVFVTDKKPNAPRRKDLAKKLKMSPREVQVMLPSCPKKKIDNDKLIVFPISLSQKVWFQNRRAKEKKAFSKKDPSGTSSTASTTTASAAPVASIQTDVSPSSDVAPDGLPDSLPSPSSASPVTKIEPQTPEPSPRPLQGASWQHSPSTDSLDQRPHHATPPLAVDSSPDASPTAYGPRRSSLPVLSLVPPQELSSTLSHDQHPSHEDSYHLPPSFPSAVLSPNMLHHRRSTSALAEHPYALPVCRPSPTHADYPPPSGPPPGVSPPHPPAPYMRASISEGMDMPGLTTSRFASSGGVGVQGTQTHLSARFHPFQSHSRRPNLAHRASVPAIFHTTHTHAHASAPPMPMSSFPATPTSAISFDEQHHHHQRDMFAPAHQQDPFSWTNPDPFGAGAGAVALAPDAGYSFGLPPAVATTAGVPTSGYEFPERKHSAAGSELDSEYTFALDDGVYRRPGGSVVSLYGSASDTGTTASTTSSAGPYFSDVTSEGQGIDENGRRGSCVSTSELLSRLHVGGGAGEGSASPPGTGSDGYASEHGTVTYPSPTSDSERVNMGTARIGQSPVLPQTSGSSELALALHSNQSVSPLSACFQLMG